MKNQKGMTPAQVVKSISRGAHKATATGCHEAWWYENKGSIEIYMHDGNKHPGKIMHCRIQKAAIKRWLKRVEG